MSAERPHYFGHRERLRQRFIKNGLDGFADYEVVELLLTLAIPRRDVKEHAKALIARFGNLRGILDAPLEELEYIVYAPIGKCCPNRAGHARSDCSARQRTQTKGTQHIVLTLVK